MDTLGALALATEMPTPDLLERRPYKRSARLISAPMWRNILCQSIFQLALLFFLLFAGPKVLNIKSGIACFTYAISSPQSSLMWDTATGLQISNATLSSITCASFGAYCPNKDEGCLGSQQLPLNSSSFSFENLEGFTNACLTCVKKDYTHGTILFNSFIFCQIFNEFSSRKLFNEINIFRGVCANSLYLYISFFMAGFQILLVEFGGDFVKTSSLSFENWLISIAFGKFSYQSCFCSCVFFMSPLLLLTSLLKSRLPPHRTANVPSWLSYEAYSHQGRRRLLCRRRPLIPML